MSRRKATVAPKKHNRRSLSLDAATIVASDDGCAACAAAAAAARCCGCCGGLLLPLVPGRRGQLELFAQSAKTAGLEHVVCVLGSGVGTAPADAAAIDRAAVAALAKAGVPFTLVAPRCASLGDMSGWYYRKV